MAEEIKITLKAARVNAGLTQDDVSRKMRISKHTLIDWEKGKTQIPYISLTALSGLYKMPMDYIYIPQKST